MENGRRLQNLFAGAAGEAAAADFLRGRGFAVLERNWRNPADRREEIDLVCREDGILVFVEVKARAHGARVPGYFAVDRRKRRALRRAIGAYLRLLPRRPRTHRLDVVEVTQAAEGPRILHFENVELCSKPRRG
ncbi:MAG TPA: YraN family protein [Opitutaceae bacterium]|nr:YraN family protein [Opitutaceae bacterium]